MKDAKNASPGLSQKEETKKSDKDSESNSSSFPTDFKDNGDGLKMLKKKMSKENLEKKRQQKLALKKIMLLKQELKRRQQKGLIQYTAEQSEQSEFLRNQVEATKKKRSEANEKKLVGQKRKAEQSQAKAPKIKEKKQAQQETKNPTKSTKSKESVPDFTDKNFVVNEFAQRYNYILPAWPPPNFDYQEGLKKKNLQLLSKANFNKLKNNPDATIYSQLSKTKKQEQPEPLAAKKGKKKKDEQITQQQTIKIQGTICYQVDFYPGLFKDVEDKIHDLRPHDESKLIEWLESDCQDCTLIAVKPTVNNFSRWHIKTLHFLLMRAYCRQLEALTSRNCGFKHYDKNYEINILIPDLKRKIQRLQNVIDRAFGKNVAVFKPTWK